MSHTKTVRARLTLVPQPTAPSAPAPAPAEAPVRRRGDSPHPHVQLYSPKATGRRWWLARVDSDPSDPRRDRKGRPVYKVTLTGKSDSKALAWARTTSERIVRELLNSKADGKPRLQLRMWSPDRSVPSGLRRYVEWFEERQNKQGQKRADTTVQNYLRDCLQFVEYMGAAEVTHLHELTIDMISDWRDARAKVPAVGRGGRPRKASTLNQERKSVRAWLRRMVRSGYARNFSVDELYGALELETELEPARRFVLPTEYAAVLSSALQRDSGLQVEHEVAPMVLLCIKTGLRLEEATLLQVHDVEIGGDWGAMINLPANKAKFGRARAIQGLPFSPVAVELLTAMCMNRGPDEYLSELTRRQLGKVNQRMRERHGMPCDITTHALRSTAICYAGPMILSGTVRREQFGNGDSVSAKHYEAARGHLPITADSIDDVVRLKAPDALPIERAIIDAEWSRAWERKRRRRVAKRTALRVRSERPALPPALRPR